MADEVLFEVTGHVATITLNRPEARNAINGSVTSGMEAAIDEIEGNPDIRAGVLTANVMGHGQPVFCAGADLKVINAGQQAALYTERGGFGGFVFRERTKPIVAAVDGLATAGGLEFALACDIVVCTTRSNFALAEVTRNLVAAAGGLFRLPRLVGTAVAMDAILTGDPIDARRAHQLGLVSRLVEPGEALAEALRVATKIAENAPLAVRASKRVVDKAMTGDDATLIALSNRLLAEMLASDDAREGTAAFIEKRQPRWQGR